jgi:glycosyltransferase involved in cell wall biosynthesis
MIVGANPPPELQALASESILVTGYVPDLRPYFELASLFISPLSASLGVSQDILKAVSMLTPVVATPASLDNLAAFEANLHLLVGESDDELIRHSIRLLREEQTRLNLSILAREALLQHYSWEQVALRYEAFVRGVAG